MKRSSHMPTAALSPTQNSTTGRVRELRSHISWISTRIEITAPQ